MCERVTIIKPIIGSEMSIPEMIERYDLILIGY